MSALGFLLISAVATFLLYPPFINFLYRFQMKEAINPDVPRTHFAKQGTPTAAGLLPIGVFLVLNLLFNLTPQVWVLVGMVGAMAALGLAEDLLKVYRRSRLQRTIRERIVPIVTMSDLSWDIYKILLFPWNAFREVFRSLGSQNVGGIMTYQKILYQTALAALLALWLSTVGGTQVWLPILGTIEFGLAYFPMVIVVFLFLVNSVSITDGLDGLVGGLLMIAFTAILSLALMFGKNDLAIATGILLGGLLPFLYFNVFPARFFAGNVGALGWAAAFGTLAMLLERSFLIFIIGGVFIAEGLSVVLQVGAVKLGRKKLFLMAPIHHHFEIKGWAETKVTMRFWLVGVFLAFLGLFLASL